MYNKVLNLKNILAYCQGLHLDVKLNEYNATYIPKDVKIIVCAKGEINKDSYNNVMVRDFWLNVEDIKSFKDIDDFYKSKLSYCDRLMAKYLISHEVKTCYLLRPFQFIGGTSTSINFQFVVSFE